MNISDYEQIQHAIQVRDIKLACSCMNSSYVQAIIDADKEVELNEQLVKLFALLDILLILSVNPGCFAVIRYFQQSCRLYR